MRRLLTKRHLVFAVFCWCFVGSCGGSTSPTLPAGVPTPIEYASIEYAGGAVDGDLSVQMGKTLSFIVKDADGNVVSDPEITVAFQDSSGETVTDGSCGSVASAGSDVIYTAPLNWKGITSQCSMNVYQASTDTSVSPDGSKVLKADDDTPLGEFTMVVSLSPDQAESTGFSFSSKLITSDAYLPAIALDYNINIHICYTDYTSRKVYYSRSADLGATWSTAEDTGIGSTDVVTECAVAANSDGTIVGVAGRYLSSAVVDRQTVYSVTEKMSYSTDGGDNFSLSQVFSYSGSTSSVRGAPVIAMDSNGVVHVAIFDEVVTEFPNIYLSACTTSCSNYAAAVIPVGMVSDTDMAITSDGKIYVVYIDSSNNGGIVQATYDGSAYSVGSSSQFASAADNPGVTINMSDFPILTWDNSASIYEAPWDGAIGDHTKVVDFSSTLLNDAPFISYDNYVHVLYNVLAGTMYHTMQDGSGGYTTPNAVELEGFDSNNSRWGLANDIVGRPYVIWNSYDVTAGLEVYLAVGQIVTSE